LYEPKIKDFPRQKQNQVFNSETPTTLVVTPYLGCWIATTKANNPAPTVG
jgi:hypothetical protein